MSAPRASIRTAIFGNGFARAVILPCLRHLPEISLEGLSSPNLERARQTAREFAIPRTAADHREILEQVRPDLVFVVTPPHRHEEMACDALQAGCHVICEKPMALDAGGSARMLAAARARPRQLALIDHELRFLPARRELKRLLREGSLGRCLRADYSLHTTSRRDPSAPWTWWSDAGQGGGILGAIGSHAVDALQVLLGEILAVRGTLHTFVSSRKDPTTGRPREVTSDDFAQATLAFSSGTLGSMTLSAVEGTRHHRLTLTGTDGTARVEEQGPLRILSGPGARESKPVAREIPLDDGLPPSGALGIPDTDWSRAFLLQAREVVRAILESRDSVPGAASFEDGHRTQQVLDAVRRSHEGGWTEVLRS